MAETYSARTVAAEASKMLGRNVSPKQVRGLARGDNGPAIVERLDDEGYSAHVYSAKERTALLTAFAARESKRTGRKVNVPAVKPDRKERTAARARKATPDVEAPSEG